MAKYTVSVSFTTDRDLCDDELEHLASFMTLQVEEPIDVDGHEVHVKTSDVRVRVKSVCTREFTKGG